MKLRITEAVLAEAYRAKVCRERMEELAEGTALAAEDENTAGGVRQ